MRNLILAVFIWLGTFGLATAQGAEIEDTISQQIEAFKADDFQTAFTFASPSIQGMFRTPENFGLMVRQGYPMVWRPAQVQYLEMEERNGLLFQKVMITDAQGVVHILAYQMVELENGWKINGVTKLEQAGVNA